MITNAKVPYLPPEVWLVILEWATYVPNAFDLDAPDLFAYPGPWTQEQIQDGLRQSLLTKRRLVLVCKSWNVLATRFLYKALPIVRLKSMKKLLSSLKLELDSDGCGMATFDHRIARSRAACAVRLDISLRSDRYLPRDDFSELLRCLPNLQIIVLRRGFPTFVNSTEDRNQYFFSFFDTLASQVTRTLHVLDIVSTDSFLSEEISKMAYTINGQPLRMLRIRPSLSMVKVGKRIEVPEVQYLDLPWQLLEHVIASMAFPTTLAHLSLDTNLIAANSVVNGSFSPVRPQITTLEVDDGFIEILGFCETSFEQLLRKIAELCPHLRDLIINLRNMLALLPTTYLPPIERLGLRLHAYVKKGNSKYLWKEICGILSRLIEHSPTLKIIRIIDRPTLEDLTRHHVGILKILRRDSLAFLIEHDVRFEDCTGRLFHEAQPSHERLPTSLSDLEALTQATGELSV